jgi:hypothetical protein
MSVHNEAHLGTLVAAMSSPETYGSSSSLEAHDSALADDDAPEGVTVERAAEIEAFLTVCTDEPRDQLLSRFDIDEERWGYARRVWTERIEDEVMRASAPGLRLAMDEKYRLSMRYSIAYSNAAERAREPATPSEPTDVVASAGAALGSNQMLRLGSSHG